MPIGVRAAASLLALTLVAGRASADVSPTISACPPAARAGTACYVGQDPNGAHYLIAIPENWNRVLVMHARGGPYQEHPGRSEARRMRRVGLYGCRKAMPTRPHSTGAAGSRIDGRRGYENLRRYFVKTFGAPRRTIMHGQSWGRSRWCQVIELYGTVRGPATGAAPLPAACSRVRRALTTPLSSRAWSINITAVITLVPTASISVVGRGCRRA